MKNSLDNIYNTHKEHNIAFNQNVVSRLGIIYDQVYLKCRDIKVPCAIYSSSMIRAKIIAKLDYSFLNNLRLACSFVTLRLNYIENGSKKETPFCIGSKILHFKKFSLDKPDIYYITLEYVNRPPDELISILGNHILKQLYYQKRAVQRYILNPIITKNSNIMEQFLFKSGRGKKCILTEISLFSAKIIINGVDNEFLSGDSVLLLIKSAVVEGLGEMVGHIKEVEFLDVKERLYSLVIHFNQDLIPPLYKMWLADCIDVIKPDLPLKEVI